VVGGGVAGLAAAHRIVERAPQVEVIVLEQGPSLGGKLRTTRLAGRVVEQGAETMLVADSALATSAPGDLPGGSDDPAAPPPRGGDSTRGDSVRAGDSAGLPAHGGDSAALELARAVGLGEHLVHPTAARAAIAVDGVLAPMPAGTLMGIPLVDDSGLDTPSPAALLAGGADVSVGGLVRPRRGDRAVDGLVEPLLGGVYAGRADALSLRMAIPALARAAESAHTLTDAVRGAVAARTSRPGRPVFATVEGGLGSLVAAVAARLPEIRLSSVVRDIARTPSGWRLVVGSTRDATVLDCDGLVLAVPAAPAARLLSTVDGVTPIDLAYASVALVGLALPSDAVPELSGFLVPPREGYAVKAATFFDRKWTHHRADDGISVIRASLGRAGDEAVLQRDDAELVRIVRDDLARLLGRASLPSHRDAAVWRWGGALPQYTPGHVDRVATLRAGLARHPAIAVAGAAYDGVGIPACVRSGQVAADHVLKNLGGWTP
jgi:oxygen-dependent protoporphyrinogen oxidase